MANQMKTLILEYLAPYLPYDLNIIFIDDDYRPFEDKITKIILPNKSHNGAIETKNGLDLSLDDFKPILRPLSDLFNDKLNPIPINEMRHRYGWDYLWLNIYKNKEEFNINALKWACLNIMLKHHFDVFGLIEAGLAIDINTLTPNK